MIKFRLSAGLLSTLLLFPADAPAGNPVELIGQNWTTMQPGEKGVSLQQSEGGVLTISVHTKSDPPWKIQVSQVVESDLQHDRFRLSFRARSLNRNPIRAVVEETNAPFVSAAELTPTLEPDWQSFSTEGFAPGYGRSGLSLRFQLGQQAGTIELEDIHLVALGADPAYAEAARAIEPAAIAARIDRYRKRTLSIHIVGADGRPVSNAQVQVTQTRHAFWFGCNLFGLNLQSEDPLQKQYQTRFSDLFNYATLPFYWGSYEKIAGQTTESLLMKMAMWCRDHHITAKGHPLVYHIVYPSWAPKDAAAAIPMLHARVTDIITRFNGLVNVWDVINEANSATWYPSTGVGAWVARDGAQQVVATVLNWARAAGTQHDETFLYNDNDRSFRNLELLQSLKDHHQLPDAIGIQSHMHAENWKPEEIWVTAEHFKTFGVPLHFTETTVLSGEHRSIPNAPGAVEPNWKSTADGEKEQARYVVQFYSILFSHPAIRAITWWDLSDRNAWLGAPAGLLRADMTPKPAYDALEQLIHHEWWTNVHLTSNEDGDCRTRAFCGDYSISIKEADGRIEQRDIELPANTTETDSDMRVEIRL